MREACIVLVLAAGCDRIRDVEFGIEERPANLTCAPPTRPVPGSGVRLERVFPDLVFDQATTLARAASDPLHWYVTEQHSGRILRFAVDPGTEAEVVLDIGDRLGPNASEAGLLGIAFHPSFATNGHLYVSYNGANLTSTLSRFTTNDGGATFDPDSEEILLTQSQPFTNHKGGNIVFGPDGYLYFGLGDGGSAGDPGNRAQDPGTLLGKMLRIDVDSGAPYGTPPDNPYVGATGRDEIYAIGLRNPYRFAFDSETDDLWVGDVGQDEWEEVDLVTLGGNYGWRIMEGPECFNPPNGCDDTGLVPPIAWYPNDGSASVIMGPVYRGGAIPSLQGAPIYSDFYTGDVWALISDQAGGYDPLPILEDSGHNIAHWAVEPGGEVLALTYGDGIWRLVPDAGATPDPTPVTLSATGCVDPGRPDEPAPGLVPYGVAVPFWSDGADKRRWMALPDGEAATVGPDGDLDFPPGTVLVKEMNRDGRPIETRLFVRYPDGEWGGLTYAWRDDGSDADLVDVAGTSVDLEPPWSIPSRAGCMQCHTEAAGHTLGLELQQLAGTYVYPRRRRADQIATLAHLGLIEGVPDEIPGRLQPGVAWSVPVDERARAWLHVNCAGCHRPGGQADMDLRMHVPFAETGMCAAPQRGDLGIADARLVAPGDPDRSIVLARAARRDTSAMPPLASNVPDPLGVWLLDAWISDLPADACD